MSRWSLHTFQSTSLRPRPRVTCKTGCQPYRIWPGNQIIATSNKSPFDLVQGSEKTFWKITQFVTKTSSFSLQSCYICRKALKTWTIYKYWLLSRSPLKIFDLNVRKMLPEIKDWGQHFTNYESKIFNDDQHASHYLFCYTSKPKEKINRNYLNKKAVTTSMLTGQQCVFVNVTWRDLDQSRACILR